MIVKFVRLHYLDVHGWGSYIGECSQHLMLEEQTRRGQDKNPNNVFVECINNHLRTK